MTQVIESSTPETRPEVDLPGAIQHILASSAEPLTLSKLRSRLPMAVRTISLEELETVLRRLVSANVLHVYPRYRSQQERYWDRGMPIHIACVLRETLETKPLPVSELRRKLPAYVLPTFEEVLRDQVAQGLLHRHPPASKRGPERFGATAPDPKAYLIPELTQLFTRLEELGFTRVHVREAALELLHEEEWASNLTPREQTAEAGEETAAQGEAPEAVGAESSLTEQVASVDAGTEGQPAAGSAASATVS